VLDIRPATDTLVRLVSAVGDDQLTRSTPCAGSNVAHLLDHVDGLAFAFSAAGTKTRLPLELQAPKADAAHLTPEWRTQIPERLEVLAGAWADPGAWVGLTQVGGQELPGELAGVIALNEVVVHGWDIAVACGQPYDSEPVLVDAAIGFVAPTAAASPQGTPGLFGPPVTVSEDAPSFYRLLGLTGRDPFWGKGDSNG